VSSPVDQLAQAAVQPVTTGMVVGLGTGRAAARGIRALAARAAREGLVLTCVATSAASEAMARGLGLVVNDLRSVERVDYLFDGADEIDPGLAMIKGGGGAMTRERLVAHVCLASGGRCVYIADESKMVHRLGERRLLPVEVLPMAASHVLARLDELGLKARVRATDTGAEFVTDNAGLVLDAQLPEEWSTRLRLAELADELKGLSGVIDHGLFLTEASEVIVEDASGGLLRLPR
jgi:ribose 5-phosphate isomerase A